VILGNDGFQLFVNVLGSTNEADGAHSEPMSVKGAFGGFDEPGMVGEAEVIIGAEVEHLFAVDGDGGGLGARDDSLGFVGACRFDQL
jgi:hypothetical protein